jgi:invasion protein IalB
MLHLRPFLVALMLACTPGTDIKVIAKQQLGNMGLAREGVSFPASPRLAQLHTTESATQLPNGASLIREIYGNWIVDCRLPDGQKNCWLLPIQSISQTNQRRFAVEIQMLRDGTMEGTILLPFGLKLDSGAIAKLDDKVLDPGLRFLTCAPVGCLLPVSLPAIAVDAIKRGKMLTVDSRSLDDEVVTFNASLDGFAAATARIVELGGWKPSNPSPIQGQDGD